MSQRERHGALKLTCPVTGPRREADGEFQISPWELSDDMWDGLESDLVEMKSFSANRHSRRGERYGSFGQTGLE